MFGQVQQPVEPLGCGCGCQRRLLESSCREWGEEGWERREEERKVLLICLG